MVKPLNPLLARISRAASRSGLSDLPAGVHATRASGVEPWAGAVPIPLPRLRTIAGRGTIRDMRFLALAVLGMLIPCSCRTRANPDAPPPPAARSPLPTSIATEAPPRSDAARKESPPLDSCTRIPDVVFRYRTASNEVRTTRGPVALPGLWALADSARDTLVETMERFSEAAFRRAESLMVWHVLSRSESISALPAYDSFLALARVRGTPSDTAYFAYLAAEEGGWKWRTSSTDFQACDEFGSPHLVAALGGAERLRADPANPYRNRLPDPASEVRRSLEHGLCACGTAPETLRDFERNFAKAPLPPAVRPLLDSLRAILRSPRPEDRFECHPG
jgi:hypothetical protein